MVDERRKHKRKFLTYFSRVVDRRSNRLLGYLLDLTTEGAMVVGDQELPAGTNLSARIDLPEELSSQQYMDIEAQVMWSGVNEDDGTYKAGLRLTNIAPTSVEMLQGLIQQYGM